VRSCYRGNLRIAPPPPPPPPPRTQRLLPTTHPVAAALFKPTASLQKRACGNILSRTLQQDAVR
jgi:hypothetical protein